MDRSRIPVSASCPRLRAQLAQESGLHPLASTDEAPNLAIDSWVVNPAGGVCRKSFSLLLAACFWPSLAVARALRKRQIVRHVLDAGNPPGPFFTPQRATVRAAPPGVCQPSPARMDQPIIGITDGRFAGKKTPCRKQSTEERRKVERERSTLRYAFSSLPLCSSPALSLLFSRAVYHRRVEPKGLEPSTLGLQSRCSPS